MAGSDPGQPPGTESELEKSSSTAPEQSGQAATASETKAPDAADTANKPADGEASSAGAASPPQAPEAASEPAHELHPHHVSKILDEVLEEPEPDTARARRFKHPMVLDLVLAVGLLVAVGGFFVGLFKMYLTHSAEQSIMQHNYKAAIAILKGAPLPGLFTLPGAESPEELLSQALYLDAMEKLEVDNDIDGAIRELQQIKPGSRYFTLAQEIITEHYEPSSTVLQGGTEHIETNPQAPVEKKPILPELKDAVD